MDKIPYELFNQFETSKIDYNQLFKTLDLFNFTLYQVDDFIKNNDIAMQMYMENIIFQYAYLILSPYTFKDRTALVNAFNSVHQFILENKYKSLELFLNSLSKKELNNKDFNITIKKVNKFINDPEYASYIEKILNSKEKLGCIHHSNIFETHAIIANTLKMLFVHAGNIDLTDFLENITKTSIDKYSINLLKQKCDNSKVKFFEYMLNYYENRFSIMEQVVDG